MDQVKDILTAQYSLVQGSVRGLKCPLCGKDMAGVTENSSKQPSSPSTRQEVVYVCEQHGVMNKATDLKNKADEIAKKA
ncbi:MAG TPA: hypothetical protein VLV18_04425 [Terriglobales bacterium]|nr:hypothetical protein [Terriglobales bacterium]